MKATLSTPVEQQGKGASRTWKHSSGLSGHLGPDILTFSGTLMLVLWVLTLAYRLTNQFSKF